MSSVITRAKGGWLVLLAGFFWVSSIVNAASSATNQNQSSNTIGSGERFTTFVTERTEGELKPEDERQVSTLGSRVLAHVNNAVRLMAADQADKAKAELEQAQKLAGIIRQILPVTVVDTTVNDAKGTEVYRYEDRVQDEQVPIFRGSINVEVVQPLVEAKKEQAAVKGVRLTDADLIHTSILLDLGYTEQKIRQALTQINQPERAEMDLASIAAVGVRFNTEREEHPLVQVQAALNLAERQVREQKFDGAKANLQLARVELEAYRTFVGEAGSKDASDLEKEINNLEQKLREPGAADKIRGYWNRVTSWFKPGQNMPTNASQQAQASTKSKS